MKKLLAILTVMCMVLTTMIVPTVAFGDVETNTVTLHYVDLDGNVNEKPYFSIDVPVGSSIHETIQNSDEIGFSDPVELGYGFNWVKVNIAENGTVTYPTDDNNNKIVLSFEDTVTESADYYLEWHKIDEDNEPLSFSYSSDEADGIAVTDHSGMHQAMNQIGNCIYQYDSEYKYAEDEEWNWTIASDEFIKGSEGAVAIEGLLTVTNEVNAETSEIASVTFTFTLTTKDENGDVLATETLDSFQGILGLEIETNITEEGDFYLRQGEGESALEWYGAINEAPGIVEIEIYEKLGTYTFGFEAYENEGNEGDGDEGDTEDNEGSSGMVFFAFSSNGGKITSEWTDGSSETMESMMWHFASEEVLEDVWGDGDQSEIVKIEKDNAILQGWKLYTGDEFEYEFYPKGEAVNLKDGDVTRTYTETWYFDKEEAAKMGFDEEGYYNEYLAITNQEEVAKADRSLYTIDDFLNLNVENPIYFAVAQWATLDNEKIFEALEEGAIIVLEDEQLEVDPVAEEEIVEVFGQDDVDKVVEKAANDNIVQYFDVSYLVTIKVVKADGTVAEEFEEENVEELTSAVEVTIPIPDNLGEVEEGYVREFYVIRVHDGVVEELKAEENDDGTISFMTDRFSTYALAYRDVLESSVDDDNQGSGTTPGTTPGNSGTNTPAGGATSGTTATPDSAVDTGDNFNVIPYIAVMVIALAGVAVAMLRRRAE